MKRILIVGAGPSQSAGVAHAKKMGYKVVAIDGDPKAPGLKLADVPIVLDVRDKKSVLRIAREQKVDGILSIASDICLETVASVNEILCLPGISPERLLPTINKGVMRKILSACGLPGPRYFIIESEALLQEAAFIVTFPAVVKPVDSAGSRGVSFVETMDDLAIAYARAVSCSPLGVAILEQFIPGPEISVEAFVADGYVHVLTLSDKDRTKPPYLLDTAVKFPSILSESIQREVRAIAVSAIKALEFDNCPVHMEMILTSEGPKVVELAARGPGFRVYTDILPHVTGVNGVEAQIRILFDETPDLRPRMPLRGACIKFFSSQNKGVVKKIRNFDEIASHPEIYDLQLYVKPGDKVDMLTCGPDRIGHVIILSETRHHAVSLANYAIENVKIELM